MPLTLNPDKDVARKQNLYFNFLAYLAQVFRKVCKVALTCKVNLSTVLIVGFSYGNRPEHDRNPFSCLKPYAMNMGCEVKGVI